MWFNMFPASARPVRTVNGKVKGLQSEYGSPNMLFQVSGKQIDIGDALRTHVETELGVIVDKYFERAIDAGVVFSREGHTFRTDCSVHVGSGIAVQCHALANDIYASFDMAASRVEKQLRRYKRRLRNHHGNRKPVAAETQTASAYVIAWPDDDGPEQPVDAAPVIVAESAAEVATLTVGEAVMRMDLADQPAMMFRNSAHGGLNMIYRRPDGNIGWIDPHQSSP